VDNVTKEMNEKLANATKELYARLDNVTAGVVKMDAEKRGAGTVAEEKLKSETEKKMKNEEDKLEKELKALTESDDQRFQVRFIISGELTQLTALTESDDQRFQVSC
jgi:hypothetical protein